MEDIRFKPITRDNWEDVLELSVHENQRKFVPSTAESVAAAYIKPWDEALDPFAIYLDELLIGCFYVSYTPDSVDNYWLGGFMIDKKYQGKGYGKKSLQEILVFIKNLNPKCERVNLTVEKDNTNAQRLYKSLGFDDTGKVNKYDEIIYILPVKS